MNWKLVDKLMPAARLLGKQEPVGKMPKSSDILRRFVRLAWPSITESVLLGLISFADTAMVATVGDEAIKAVGLCAQPRLMLLCPSIALGAAVTAVAARRTGERNQEDVNRVLRNGLFIGLICILLLGSLGAVFAAPFLRFAGASDSYIDLAVEYFRIICVSLLFVTANIVVNGTQRGSGNTRIAMVSNVVGNLVNVLFNWLLINGVGPFPRLGVKGAAIATALGSVVSLCVSASLLFKRNNYVNLYCAVSWRFSGAVLKPLAAVGISALAEGIACRVGFFLVSMMNARLPGIDYTAHVACSQVLTLSFCFVDGFGTAATALTGQYLGEKRPDKAYMLSGIGKRAVIAVDALLATVIVIWRREIVQLFSKTPEVIERGEILMFIAAAVMFGQGLSVMLSGILRGAGDTRFTARTSLISIAVLRPACCWLLAYGLGFGLVGSWVSMTVDILVRVIMYLTRVKRGEWLKIKL